jgi:formylglycine-generating enzyme required for sulfatase activity
VCVDDNDAAADIPGPNPCGAATPSPELDEKDKMAIVPAGPFWQGCNLAVDPWCVPVEMPGRCVTLSAYEIDLTEVSQGDYDKCVAAEHCSRPASCGKPFNYSPIFTPDLPVACVSWEQAQQYCGWVANGTKRLPTEAEWEKAARGVDGRLYPWGNENPDSQANPCNWAVYDLCPSSEKNVGTTPYDVSPYGVRDLAGNVWEWVSDWYDPQYYQTAPTTDPQGPAQNPTIIMSNYGPFHVYRGGGITDQTTFLRASNRFGGPPGVYPNVGLRCARSMN